MSRFLSSASPLLGALLGAGVLSAQPPAIVPGGIVNSASLMPSSLPGGRLAPGMEIVVPGIRFVDPGSETTVDFTHGDWHASVKPSTLEAKKLTVAVPSAAPLGEVAISVVNGQGASRPETLPIVASSPGIVTLNGRGWGPAIGETVHPKQRVTLRVNGLHEDRPKVWVANVAASDVSVKESQLSFTIPSGAPAGCWTPVWIESRSGGVSNFVTIPLSGDGKPCEQAQGWFAKSLPAGTKSGLVALVRISGLVQETGPAKHFGFEAGSAFFYETGTGPIEPLQLAPPSGSCLAFSGTFAFEPKELMRMQELIGSVERLYDAGPSLTVQLANGVTDQILNKPLKDPFYTGFFGGTLPITWEPNTKLILNPGEVRIQDETGGSNIGKFEMKLQIPPPFEWTNFSDLEWIDRHEGVELHWKNLEPDRQMIAIAFNVDQDTSTRGSVICTAALNASEIAIPPSALANFPPTQPRASFPLRFILLASVPASLTKQPIPAGLDDARAIFLETQVKTVRFR